MTVHTQPSRATAPDTGAPNADRRTGALSITRVVLGSLVVGAVSALVLTLVVFPGATEAVVTGSLLLGFGVGWAALVLVSARRTNHPQRWARVPEVAMTARNKLLALACGIVGLSSPLAAQDPGIETVSWPLKSV